MSNRILSVGSTFPEFNKTAVVSLEKGKEFANITSEDRSSDASAVGFPHPNDASTASCGNPQVCSAEYKLTVINLSMALDMALKAKAPVLSIYTALSQYYDIHQNHSLGLKMGQKVIEKIKGYSGLAKNDSLRLIVYSCLLLNQVLIAVG